MTARPMPENLFPLVFCPLWVRCAVERVQQDEKLRTGPQLNELLEGYAKAMGRPLDVTSMSHEQEEWVTIAYQHCQRLSDFMP